MKTLHDIQHYCYGEIEWTTERIIDELNEFEDMCTAKLHHMNGQLSVYRGLVEEIRSVLKHHECEYLNDRCVLCGETAEAV
jgi:hypothetical protein